MSTGTAFMLSYLPDTTFVQEKPSPLHGAAFLMGRTMAKNVKDLLAEANSTVPKLSPDEAVEKMQSGDVLIVDVRDPTEVQQTGRIKGAVNVSRGMLEFRADPDSQYHNPAFQKDKTILLQCASGGRSALGGKTRQDMGYMAVFNIGGFKDLAEAGIDTEPA